MELLTPKQRIFLKTVCSKPNRWRVNKKTGMIDVDCNINMTNMKLTEIPVKFGRVQGRFSCSYNNLTTLKNCPIVVNFIFYCHNNKLTDYFKSIKEEDFPRIIFWENVISEYPFLINRLKGNTDYYTFKIFIDTYPQTKLYLED